MRPQELRRGAGEARRYDLDWLRVLATLLIFLYHSTRPFDTYENWHVKNSQLSDVFTFVVVGGIWIMPLFFVLAGAGSYHSLRSRRPWSFLRARFLRLAVPLMTVGWFLFGPIQVYIERVTGTGYNTAPFSGSFLAFIPHYFEGIYGRGGSFALQGVHLWFLYWLFLFSLLTLPLFVYLLRDSGRRLVAALGRMAERPGAIFLLGLPLALVEALIRLGIGPDVEEGGWYLVSYVLLLVYGFLIAADPRFDRALQRHRWAALGLALLLLLLLGATMLLVGPPSELAWLGPAGPILEGATFGLDGWLWLAAILGFARLHLDRPHPGLRYAGEAVLPFYILHQPIIVILAYLMRGWELGVGAKFILLSSSAFVVIMLLYELLIRRLDLLRFLFGMKLLPRRRPALQSAAGI